MTDDGILLHSTSHSVAPWWYRIWVRVFKRDISSSAVITRRCSVLISLHKHRCDKPTHSHIRGMQIGPRAL